VKALSKFVLAQFFDFYFNFDGMSIQSLNIFMTFQWRGGGVACSSKLKTCCFGKDAKQPTKVLFRIVLNIVLVPVLVVWKQNWFRRTPYMVGPL